FRHLKGSTKAKDQDLRYRLSPSSIFLRCFFYVFCVSSQSPCPAQGCIPFLRRRVFQRFRNVSNRWNVRMFHLQQDLQDPSSKEQRKRVNSHELFNMCRHSLFSLNPRL